MTTVEGRVGRLEGLYESLATKEDIANLRSELKADIGNLKGEFTWRVASLQLLGLGVVVAIIRFLG